ncbi:MAG TPA: hypothetical protein DDZ11_12340 [Lentisphaeria bacterium]|nr:hypothetical protein [Lentisphaeria bacterium]
MPTAASAGKWLKREEQCSKNDCGYSFFITCFMPVDGGKDFFEPADFLARHLLFQKQEERR